MKREVLGITMALLATLSCVKENEQELQPVDGGEERFAEFDPVVRFGLDTYMGGADDSEPLTKTTYAGDDKTIVLNKVRYERINWNGTSESNPDDPAYQDVIQIISQTNFTPKNDKPSVSYKVVAIPDWTNPSGNNREDYADAEPYSGSSDDYFYWSRPAGSKDTDKHYFYAVYPTSESDKRASTQVTSFSLNTSDSDPAKHFAKFSGYINKRVEPSPGENPGADADCREQKYLDRISYTDGLLGNGQTCHEYLPDMKNAYLYAASAMPGADAGYKKVPLRFKPLYSAVKLIVTARDGAKNYRLKRVDLRTDLHNNGDNSTSPGRLDLNDDGVGTALGGSFSTYFKADASSGTTADFAKIDPASDPNTALADTLKRLYIEIDPADRIVLGDDVLKLTFLVLPIEQSVMTVEYTFEYMKDDTKGWTDPENVVEVHRYLSLQNKTNQPDNKGYRNEFTNNDWFTLDPANKLYVKSNVPAIQYFFKVQAQGNFPRTWNSGDDIKDGTHYYSDDFYSVQSYRDSSGVKQSMKWKVTGYKPEGESSFYPTKPASVSWLKLRGDDGTWDPDLEISDPVNHGYDASGDPWEEPWGAGTPMESGDFSKTEVFVSHARSFIKGSSFVSYVSAAEANEGGGGYSRNESLDSDGDPDVFKDNRDWDVPVSYLCKDLDGKYYYQEDHNHTPSAGWRGLKGEAYAYDLSSHDIYGDLYSGLKNGDLGTTANSYVVSAPGWYRFPAVYGCSVKNGGDNNKSYNGTGGTYLMGAFLDHNESGITSPEIPGIDEVDVLWDDANHMVAPSSTVSTRADRRPFYHKEPSEEQYGYIYFYVDDIAQGNALLVAKSGGTIVWSWQIWAVTKPETFLRTVGVQSNEKKLDGTDNPYKSVYGTNYFWQKTDLGQHGKESDKVDPRYCDVEFTQYFRGKVVKKVVVRFLQSGVEDDRDEPIVYQWGRKDPFPRVDVNSIDSIDGTTTGIALTTENTHNTIMKPNYFYGGGASNVPTGKRYDNLWNTNVNKALTNHNSDGSEGGSLDREVEKTIYDPSPPGYQVANMYGWSGINPFSPINETRVPRASVNDVATYATIYPIYGSTWHPYYDFFAEYDESASSKRNTDDGKTIRFYTRGRLNSGNLKPDKATEALSWLSEPAVWDNGNIFYGRSLWIGNRPNSSSDWQMYPVAGQTSKQKWQRNHGIPVRPMQQPVSSP